MEEMTRQAKASSEARALRMPQGDDGLKGTPLAKYGTWSLIVTLLAL